MNIDSRDVAQIPRTGPTIVVSNHPFGMLDGAVLGEIMLRVLPDVRILTNRLLSTFPALSNIYIFLDPFNKPEQRLVNGRALKAALQHLKNGGLLVIFPAGEVSHFDLRVRMVRDPEWNDTAARLIRISGAKAVPVFVPGSNGIPFQMLGMLHARLRTAALPAELLNKQGRVVEVRIGASINTSVLEEMDDHAATQYLRLRSELLERRSTEVPKQARSEAPIAPEVSADLLESDIAALAPEHLMARSNEMAVYLASASELPNVMREIGRLRELTFREAGEGTGKPLDLDHYDHNYLHLFLWNQTTREIVGAYRIGDVPHLLAKFGAKGLYTNSPFRFAPNFLQRLGSSLELGRSFVRLEYQRQFSPLLLLWKGVGAYVARHPEYSTLVGAVSVSNQYSTASREITTRYFERKNSEPAWSEAVRPRQSLKRTALRSWEIQALCSLLPDVQDLSAPIGDLEPDGKGVPILVRQCVKMGGKLLAFSVDPCFGNTLDGFVLLDLKETNPDTLSRYMGKASTQRFHDWHANNKQQAGCAALG